MLAETPYAVVACVEFDDWSALEERVFEVQAAFTRLVEYQPSLRDWDLYMAIHVLVVPPDPLLRRVAEKIEADTRYTRKLVRVALAPDELERALRPLLPLRPAAEFDLQEPLDQLQHELESDDLGSDLVHKAIDAFRRGEEVEVP